MPVAIIIIDNLLISYLKVKEYKEKTSVKDSFKNLAKLTSEKDKTLFEETLKNATEVVMTLMYKDKSSQLRETHQVRQC